MFFAGFERRGLTGHCFLAKEARDEDAEEQLELEEIVKKEPKARAPRKKKGETSKAGTSASAGNAAKSTTATTTRPAPKSRTARMAPKSKALIEDSDDGQLMGLDRDSWTPEQKKKIKKKATGFGRVFPLRFTRLLPTDILSPYNSGLAS